MREPTVFVAAVAILLPTLGQAQFTAGLKELEKREVVLKAPLHTIIYPRPNPLNGKTSPKAALITVTSVEKGVYYSANFENLGGTQSDRDPQQLAEKVSAKTGRRGLLSGALVAKDADESQVREARLMKYDVGAKMRVKAVRIDERNCRMTIELFDEFTTKGEPTTGLTVEWSPDSTRGQIDRLLEQFFDLR
jgi:hypothetical protein